MANALSAPIVVTAGPMQGTATHDQFRANIMNGLEPPMTTHRTLGIQYEDGRYVTMEGARDDGTPATENASWDQGEYDRWVGSPEVQQALYKLKQMHDWIVAGRQGAAPF